MVRQASKPAGSSPKILGKIYNSWFCYTGPRKLLVQGDIKKGRGANASEPIPEKGGLITQ
jgi:hypothetical protein